jgi:hypothetical protein
VLAKMRELVLPEIEWREAIVVAWVIDDASLPKHA